VRNNTSGNTPRIICFLVLCMIRPSRTRTTATTSCSSTRAVDLVSKSFLLLGRWRLLLLLIMASPFFRTRSSRSGCAFAFRFGSVTRLHPPYRSPLFRVLPSPAPKPAAASTAVVLPADGSTCSSSTRLYHSSPLRNNNSNKNGGGGGFLSKLKNVTKKVLPAKWFESDRERELREQKQMVTDAVRSDLKQVFRGAPLPIRMLGGMIGPLLGNMLSELSDVAAAQQQSVETVYQTALACLQTDPAVVEALGGGGSIQGRGIVSQSSSSSSINGETTQRIELAFRVSNGGMAHAVASSTGGSDGFLNLRSLQLQLQSGRVLDVRTVPGSGRGGATASSFPRSSGTSGRSEYKDDNIIEAEIIEKDTKK
jgi:hypothetical protein